MRALELIGAAFVAFWLAVGIYQFAMFMVRKTVNANQEKKE